MPCLLFLWPFVACHQTQAFVNLDTYVHVGQSWGINLLCKVQEPRPSLLSRLTWEVGARAAQRNMDGTCAHPLNVRRAPGQTPAMWPSGCSVWLAGLPFVRLLMILMSWGVGAHSLAFGVGPPSLHRIAWPDWRKRKVQSLQLCPRREKAFQKRNFGWRWVPHHQGQFFHLGSTLVGTHGPIKGIKENEASIHPSGYLVTGLLSGLLFNMLNWRMLLVIAATDTFWGFTMY